jgi:hypothetical protein
MGECQVRSAAAGKIKALAAAAAALVLLAGLGLPAGEAAVALSVILAGNAVA